MDQKAQTVIRRILIANRGEIAVRIIRTIRAMNLTSIAIYSDTDGPGTLHCRLADESIPLHGQELKDTYLDIVKIVFLAKEANADAIHPGYGFLAENPLFAAACEEAGIRFIGPSSEHIRLMGDKIEARKTVGGMGLPIGGGTITGHEEIIAAGDSLEYPLLIKASAGGGGKAMRKVDHAKDLEEALETTSREALNYFGNGSVYIEKYIDPARHIEFQVLGDRHGNAIHLFERECSVQRRHQKIIEESPSVTLDEDTRRNMGDAAVRIVKKLGYENAGTVEFLVDSKGQYYFLEMNTRIQVEHPVTEMVTGIDLVEAQIRIAAGEPLSLRQEDLRISGHAIEARLYAEDPKNGFRPSPGKIGFYREPSGEGVRIDSSIDGPEAIWPQYDPMIAKLIVHGENRADAIRKLGQALQEIPVLGVSTNIRFLRMLAEDQDYRENRISTRYCEDRMPHFNSLMEAPWEAGALEAVRSGFLAATLDAGSKSGCLNSPFRSTGYWRQVPDLAFLHENEEESVRILSAGSGRLVYESGGKTFKLENIHDEEGNISLVMHGKHCRIYHCVTEEGIEIVEFSGRQTSFRRRDRLQEKKFVKVSGMDPEQNGNLIVSPMHGKIIRMNVKEKDKVNRGDILFTIDSMKIESNILAPRDAIIEKVMKKAGEQVGLNGHVLVIR